MGDRLTVERANPPKARESSASHPASAADALLRLQQTYGNRAMARTLARGGRVLARQPPGAQKSQSPPPNPPRPSWADQTTVGNRVLGTAIDELDKLTNDELRGKRDELAMKASKWSDDKHAEYERQLEAAEFLTSRRGIAPMTYKDPYYFDDQRAIRRRNVRVVIEQGIRDTGSLKQSIEGMTQTNDIKDDIDFFQREADEFGREFTRQARDIGQKMLAQSISQMLDVLRSYGLRSSTAVYGANQIIHGQDVDKVVESIVNAPEESGVWEKDDDPQGKPGAARKHRVSLARYVRNLKAQQEVVNKRQKEANSYVHHSPQLPYHIRDEDKPAWEAAMKRLRESQDHLKAMWAKSERIHPVLAAFRGGNTSLEDVDLGDLDQTKRGSEPQMTELLKNVLQKLADIGKVQYRLSNPSDLSPLSLPPVVAMTKAAMFIPEGSIRAGKVNDLVEAAQDKSILKYIAEGLIALIVIAAILPSGGTSLGIGISLIGAGLSAASAVEDWETYRKQKTLVNTALDRAQALSTEEPSLVGFAIDLISLGLDGAPLVKAFSEGVALRNLIRAGEDVKNSSKVKKLVDELNDLGSKTKTDAKLGEKTLEDVRAAEKEGATATKLRPPPGSEFESVEELRRVVRAHIENTLEYTKDNPEWVRLWESVGDRTKLLRDFPQDAELIGRIDDMYKLIRDPQVIEDAMAELWETAAREQITEQQALVKYFGGEDGMPRILDQNPKKFLKALEADKPLIDNVFAGSSHGSYTHMFQEYALARKIGKEEAKRFRQLIPKAVGPDVNNTQFASQVWDALFDEYQAEFINSPDGLGPILQMHLHVH